jgi:hypothetical protein
MPSTGCQEVVCLYASGLMCLDLSTFWLPLVLDTGQGVAVG